ncbi:hypothetical protein BOO88_16495 [Stutzerimonas stutzeri]|nr:hypothetical protein BOO89_02410 [Stutzerimonas stutzeri]AZO90439.1 hypothetical protein BOO88_16495 [Stutzerimonas stutzeri]
MTTLVNGFFDESGWIDVYTFSETTGEYLGKNEIYVSRGCGLPAGATLEEPPEAPEQQVAVRQQNAWGVVPDYRGVAFRTTDGAEVTHSMPGELPAELTTLPRPSAAYIWDGLVWVLDAARDLALQSRREQSWIENELHWAGREIDKHLDADPAALNTEIAWRTYRNELRAWPLSPDFPASDKRPLKPDGLTSTAS